MSKVEDRFYGKQLPSGDRNTRHFSEYNTYDILFWHNEMMSLKKEAEEAGYTDVVIGFESTLEPYEDCMLGPVQMFAEGFRDKTPEELYEDARWKKVEAFAREKGCTPYEAKQFFELQAKGLV